MNDTIEAIHLLEEKLGNLFSNYNFLIKENEILLQNVSNLQRQLLEKEQLLEQQKQEFNLLKIAKTITGSNQSTRDTKLKINALIREIDKCIVQLSE
ncbi:MAG: hypothetical protein MK076_04690 [Flavobacteriales bacterium]|nr:hypothetical protein [Flavobacteriales bacterium]NQY01330.1 hypothetical protein [Flavobacteriaceae bacterium]